MARRRLALEELRRVEPAGVVPEIVAGDLVAVGGDARDDVGAFLGEDAGGEEGQPGAVQVGPAEGLDGVVGAAERVFAQGAVLGDVELAFEVVRDILEVDAEPGLHGAAPAASRQVRSQRKPPMASRSMSERSQVSIASAGVFTIGSWMLNEVLSRPARRSPRRRR